MRTRRTALVRWRQASTSTSRSRSNRARWRKRLPHWRATHDSENRKQAPSSSIPCPPDDCRKQTDAVTGARISWVNSAMNHLPDPMNAPLDQSVLERLRGEYLEMPGMKLSIDQIRRLCG